MAESGKHWAASLSQQYSKEVHKINTKQFQETHLGNHVSGGPGRKLTSRVVGGSSNYMSHDSSSSKIEVYSNGKTHMLLKLLFFIYKCAGILTSNYYITQWELATPTLIGT